MTYIEIIAPADATGTLKKIYDAALGRNDYVAGIVQIMSRDGRVCQASMQFYVDLMKGKNGLGAAQREMIAAVVSNINECYY